jgi:cellulose synthase/poly-beta-1,6-N-acetylglucosamine synthase-like glycosyltransferase
MALNLYLVLSLLLWPLALWLAWRGERAYRGLVVLPLQQDGTSLPSLSIIVPARDEAQVLPGLLETLLRLEYPGPLEVIVVDDNSGDETAQVATSMGVKVVRLEGLPEAWLGKPHACQRGAEAASGEWLLFTDADTHHHPSSAASAVGFAMRNELDGLSALLKQKSAGAMDALVLACGFAALLAGSGAARGLFNGQYILVRRQVFRACGGFEAVRGSVLEDIAFGSRLRQLGHSAPLLRGEALAEVRMYRSLAQLWQGITRLGSGSLAGSRSAALLTALFTAQAVTPLIYVGLALAGRLAWGIPVAGWLLVALMALPWVQRTGPRWLALLAPFGSLFIILAALWGLLGRLTGSGTVWKGRRV